MMNEAVWRLEDWAKHSSALAYIAECLKLVMTEEIAGWIMRADKTAKGMWDYITEQAKQQHNKGAEGVLVAPSQMQEYIYAYLRGDGAAPAEPPVQDESPAEECPEGQMSLVDDFAAQGEGQTTLI